MDFWCIYVLCITLTITLVNSASIASDDIEEQGLYSKSNGVLILSQRNFDKKIYGQKHALLVQFYNSYCGHCRAFAPKFKAMATDMSPWKKIIQLAVFDCSIEENNEICREFEVMAYPSLRYLHENYVKGNANVGDKLQAADSAEKLKTQLINKMWAEQSRGHLLMSPPLSIASYISYTTALADVPNDVVYIFFVFENENSTVGSELALDTNDYEHIRVKRVYDVSELATVAGVTHFPALRGIKSNLEPIPLTTKSLTKQSFLRAINTFLKSKNYAFPVREIQHSDIDSNEHSNGKFLTPNADVVYYSDLEKTIKTGLHTEITRYKVLSGEPLNALLNYLDVLIKTFPFKANLKAYIVDLYNTLSTRHEWSGADVYALVKGLEKSHAPVYTTNKEYIGCRGSQPQYRGYSCGLWSLFHTLTVSAVSKPGAEGPNVLKAMHGYIKNFFGCTDCAQHFQALARNNRLFDVKGNDKAVLWLWIAHNEVNLRLAGDVTEDPAYPKIQFPSATKCAKCRLANDAWSLPDVYNYLQYVYGAANIRDTQAGVAATLSSSFSYLDIGLLSLL